MVRRLVRLILLILVAAGLGAAGYWAWREGHEEHQREAQRERAFKRAAWRFQDEKTGQVFLRLDLPTQHRLGLRVGPAAAVKWQQTLLVPGFTVLVPHRRVELRSPWTGTLKAPHGAAMPAVGQSVRKGQVLAVLLVQWSPTDRIQLEGQLRDAQGAIGETEAELRVARNTADRLRKLGSDALPAKQLTEAEGNLARLEARLATSRAREKTLSEVLAKKESDVSYPFAVPQNGELTEILRRPGEVVSAGDLVAAVYDPQELWVSAMVLPGQLDPADVPQNAEVRFPGFDRGASFQLARERQVGNLPHEVRGQFVQLKPQIDRQQQALEIVYATANPEGRIPVGLQAEVKFNVGQPADAVVVPRSAVLRRDEQRLVYLERSPEEFIKQPVEVLAEDDARAWLRPTLPAGTKIISRGAQILLSEEYKESIQLVEESGEGAEDEDGPDKPGGAHESRED
jgi:biotin carboxyl carrier protein